VSKNIRAHRRLAGLWASLNLISNTRSNIIHYRYSEFLLVQEAALSANEVDVKRPSDHGTKHLKASPIYRTLNFEYRITQKQGYLMWHVWQTNPDYISLYRTTRKYWLDGV
jgi:hypothetical protein